VATDGAGVPLSVVSAGANRHDSPLLGPTLQAATGQVGPHWPKDVTVHLDAGYDSHVTRTLLTRGSASADIALPLCQSEVESLRCNSLILLVR
jgi:hypothetical protein